MTYYLAIYNLETHESEFAEKLTEKAVPEYWTGDFISYVHERANQFQLDCIQRGGGKWRVYLSDKEAFNWPAVEPVVEK